MKSDTARIIILIIIFFAGVSVTPAENTSGIARFSLIEYELDNGLDVILVPDHSAPTVAINVWYKVGSANDPTGRSGFAHLFEHMMFQGSDNVARTEHFELISAAGGWSNATTGRDRTNYFQALPAHQLPLALWLEADRMASLVVDEANFIREREVVIEEYRLRVDNQPYGEALLALQSWPFDYAPYQRPVIGSIDDLNAATVPEIRDFHSTYYVPNNATMVVAGDIDVDETRAMIDKFFSEIPAGEAVPEVEDYTLSTQAESARIQIEDPLARVPALLISSIIPQQNDPDSVALELLANILGGGDSSRLAVALKDTGLATQASASASGNKGPGQFNVILVPNPGVDITEIETAYITELERIESEGVENAELEKAINQIQTAQVLGLQDVMGLSESVQAAHFYYDNASMAFDIIDEYAAVTSEDIQRVINDYLYPESRHIIEVIPVEPSENQETASSSSPGNVVSTDTTDAGERVSPPEPLAVRHVTLPEITETKLPNGLRVMVLSQTDLPIVATQLILPGGESAVPANQAGLASFAAALLTRGTENRSANDIAAAIEQVGGSLEASASRDIFSLSTLVLSEYDDLAFELLGDVAFNATFPQDELEVIQQRALNGLEFTLADAEALAERTFNAIVYGDHPYGNIETVASYEAVTREDIINYYNTQLDPAKALLIIAGDITPDAAIEQASNIFADWQAPPVNTAYQAVLPELSQPDQQTIYLLNRPGSSQVEVMLGHLGISGSSPERRILGVANRILGGSSSARLFRNLREEKGYTYGVYSSFSFPRDRGRFSISAAVRNEVVRPALEEILQEIEMLRSDPVPSEELDNVKNNIIGSYALSLETLLDFVNQIVSLESRGLAIDELNTYLDAIAVVTSDDVLEAAQRRLLPDQMVIVAVGDASVIRDELEQVAPVVLIDDEGNIID